MPIDTVIALSVIFVLAIVGFSIVWFSSVPRKIPEPAKPAEQVQTLEQRARELADKAQARVIDLTESKGQTRSVTDYADAGRFSLR